MRLLKRISLTTQRMKASWTMLKRRVKKKSDINYEARQTLTIHRNFFLKTNRGIGQYSHEEIGYHCQIK